MRAPNGPTRARWPTFGRIATLPGMGISLLDFVMALVRDPDAAARYAAGPAAALDAAGLAGVTSADVDSLLPVVTDSLAMSSPDFSGGSDLNDASVWASGAAAVAFEAFGPVAPTALPVPIGIIVPPTGPPDRVSSPDHAGLTLPGRPPVDPPGAAEPDAGMNDSPAWDSRTDFPVDSRTDPASDSFADTWHTP